MVSRPAEDTCLPRPVAERTGLENSDMGWSDSLA
jgi:hypothetical protein